MQEWHSIIGAVVTFIVMGSGFYFLLGLFRSKKSRGKHQTDLLIGSGTAAARSVSSNKNLPAIPAVPVRSSSKEPIKEIEAEAFIRKRQENDQKRAQAEQEKAHRIIEKEADLDRDLAQWLELEQAEITRTAVMQAAADEENQRHTQAKTIASTQAVLDWADGDRPDAPNLDLIWSKTARSANSDIAEAKEQIITASEIIEKEAEDLEYVITRLETGVDFISLEVRDTINKWKRGEIHRRSTLDDLKRKFRLKTYSIDDGWELFFIYPDWLAKQRTKLFDYVISLGARAEKTENILTVIERAEKIEWAKNLDMDMDVLFLLKEIKKMHQIMLVMENRLTKLESACKKRSEQVISPSWEPRGIL